MGVGVQPDDLKTVDLPEPAVEIRLPDDVLILVPAFIDEITTYVLIEQEDWFEAEIAFVRKFLQPGMRCLDIGANFGVYALAMAARVGPAGTVFAFEPSASTAAFLRKSAARNGFAQLQVVQAAVSDAEGTVCLGGADAVHRHIASNGEAGEFVPAVTLDGWYERQRPERVDFVKIDVEGAEPAVVAGGHAFLRTCDPLIMVEINNGGRVDLRAVDALRELGYEIYRLAPGPEFLIPVDDGHMPSSDRLDPYQLNLFACRPSRAAALEARGLLARQAVPNPAVEPGIGHRWLRQRTYFAPLERIVMDAAAAPTPDGHADYMTALDHAVTAAHPTLAPDLRWAHLTAALRRLEAALEQVRNLARLCTAARLYAEVGLRGRAVAALQEVAAMLNRPGVTLREPFLCPLARYETIALGRNPSLWFAAQTIEGLERLSNFSSRFSLNSTVGDLDYIRQTPFDTAEMERRRQLQRLLRFEQSAIAPGPLLTAAETRNAHLWEASRPQPWLNRRRTR